MPHILTHARRFKPLLRLGATDELQRKDLARLIYDAGPVRPSPLGGQGVGAKDASHFSVHSREQNWLASMLLSTIQEPVSTFAISRVALAIEEYQLQHIWQLRPLLNV